MSREDQDVGVTALMEGPIIIVGTQRSGTTLLSRMFSAHPDVFVKNELRDIDRVFRELSTRDIVAAVSKAYCEQSRGEVKLTTLIRSGAIRKWGIKDPLLTYHLDIIPKKFPNARVIAVVRDGRAVAASYRKARWGLGCNAFSAAERWTREVRLQDAFRGEHPSMAIEVRYEDLLSDTREVLSRLSDFVGIEFSDSMLHYYEGERFVGGRHQLIENVANPLQPGRAEAWRTEMSPRAVRAFESVAKEVLLLHGYPLESTAAPIPLIEQWGYRIHQAIVGELEVQYQLRVRSRLERLHGRES